MNELTMENAYMKYPYHGSELGFIFQAEPRVYIGSKQETLLKGKMVILDPDKKLKPLLEAISPEKGRQYNWTRMGLLVCMQKNKVEDGKYIIHNFINKMKEL